MQLIPAVDIKGGRCVRLIQGQLDKETVYSDDPIAMACHWDEEGANTVHVVDLDGAFDGSPTSLPIIKDIINSTSVNIQIGGGIRNIRTVERYVDLGAARLVLGTVAFKAPKFVAEAAKRFPNKIVVGIDTRNGKVAINGWVEVSDKNASDFAKIFEDMGIYGFVFTDISKDGMLAGPNIPAIRSFAKSTCLPTIASGGVSKINDVLALLALKPLGVDGMIIGKSLYDKTVSFSEALKLVSGNAS